MRNPYFLNYRALATYLLPMSMTLLNEWLPGGSMWGSEYVARNPRRSDMSAGSFKVNIRTGRWCDFATGDAGGDLISLCAYLNNLSQHKAALLLIEKLALSGKVPS